MAINKTIVARFAGIGLLAAAMFTAGFEGDVNRVYIDSTGNKTVCVGHAYTGPEGKPLQMGTSYTDEVCSQLLGQDTLAASKAVVAAVKVPISEGEMVAYTDFVFNLGAGVFRKSGLLKKLNKGDHVGACNGLLAYDKGTVKGKLVTIPGLTKRRKAEQLACLS